MVVTRQADLPLRIGTRGSPLALAQANEVRTRLLGEVAGVADRGVEIEVIKTTGDRVQDRNLSEIGGKGLFTKEIEEALLERRIDLAVHSLKDMPTVLPDGLVLAASLPREDPRDFLLTPAGMTFAALPQGAVVGTSSLRRRAQVLHRRPDLNIINFRGNVDTRIAKLEQGVVAATLVARAGLNRLARTDVTGVVLSVDEFLPAVCQGIVTIECRADDDAVRAIVAQLSDAAAQWAADAERGLLAELDGSCRTPIAGHAVCENGSLWLRGLVLAPDGSQSFAGERRGPVQDAARLGHDLGQELLDSAGHILEALR